MMVTAAQFAKRYSRGLAPAVLLLLMPVSVGAVEVRLLCATAAKSAIEEIAANFQKQSSDKISIVCANVNINRDKVEKGEAADIVMIAPQQHKELQEAGKLTKDAPVVIAKAGTGIAVRRGASKPDISTRDAFKLALLNAKGIALNDPKFGGPSGIYAIKLFEQLGLSEQLKPKLKLTTGGVETGRALVNGDAELGVAQVGEILSDPQVDLVGPFPSDIQNYTVLVAGIISTSKAQDAAREFVRYMSASEAITILKSKGLEPGP